MNTYRKRKLRQQIRQWLVDTGKDERGKDERRAWLEQLAAENGVEWADVLDLFLSVSGTFTTVAYTNPSGMPDVALKAESKPRSEAYYEGRWGELRLFTRRAAAVGLSYSARSLWFTLFAESSGVDQPGTRFCQLNEVDASKGYIGQLTGMGDDAIKRAVRELKDNGFLTVVRKPTKNRATRYRLSGGENQPPTDRKGLDGSVGENHPLIGGRESPP